MELKLNLNDTDKDMVEIYCGKGFKWLAAVVHIDVFYEMDHPQFANPLSEGHDVIVELEFKRIEEA